MKTLQLIHTHDGRVVATIIVSENANAERYANHLKNLADSELGTRAHHIGIKPDTGIARLLGVKPPLGRSSHANNVGRKPRGICAVCRKEYPLNKHGKITKHGKNYGTRQAKRCAGTDRFPYVNRDGHE
jgi:hypothetical protein